MGRSHLSFGSTIISCNRLHFPAPHRGFFLSILVVRVKHCPVKGSRTFDGVLVVRVSCDIPFLLPTRRSPYGRARASSQRLPVSLAVASILTGRILVSHSLQRFWMLTTYSLTSPTPISSQSPGRLPRVPRSISFSSFPFGLLAIPVTDRLPKLQSFRGKRITATSCLSVRASWLVSDHHTIILRFARFLMPTTPSECFAWSVLSGGQSSSRLSFIPTLACRQSAGLLLFKLNFPRFHSY
jgi:hypothetical protein